MVHIEYLDYLLNEKALKKGFYIILPKVKKGYKYHYYLVSAYTDEPPKIKFFEYKFIDDVKNPVINLSLYDFKHAEVTVVYFAMNTYNWGLINCVKEVIKEYYMGDLESRVKGIEECKKKYP